MRTDAKALQRHCPALYCTCTQEHVRRLFLNKFVFMFLTRIPFAILHAHTKDYVFKQINKIALPVKVT